jgi:uncharacterized RDD family membrane protein YckC
MPAGVHLSSPARRFGGYLLEGLLAGVTLGIGWLIWSFVVFGPGQTPAKQILNMRAVTLRTGRSSSWGRMFVREFIAKPLMGVLSFLTLGIANFWLVWDSRNQELWDKVVGTIVVNDPQKLLLERTKYTAQNIEAEDQPRELNRMPFPPQRVESSQLEPAAMGTADVEEVAPPLSGGESQERDPAI